MAVSHGCPTFSWSADPRARGYEVVLYRVEAGTGGEASEAFRVRLPAGTSAWSPDTARCLAEPGRYAWVVRSLDGAGEGEWSEPALFHLEARPSDRELAEALAVVDRYLRAGGTLEPETENGDPEGSASSKRDPGSRVSSAITPGGAAAIRGELPNPSGVVFGVVGVTNSADGAALAAHNTAGGADLILDGAVPAEVTEGGIEVDAVGSHVFDLRNVGAGSFTLRVDGTQVSLDGHAHTAGTLPATLAYVDAANSFTATNDFAGAEIGALTVTGSLAVQSSSLVTDLNADLLDGLHASDLAAAGHGHPGLDRPGFQSQELTALLELVSDTSATIGTDGLPVIAVQVFEDPDNRIYVVHCDDLVCSTATAYPLSGPKNAAKPAIALGPGKDPIVAFEVDGVIYLGICLNQACSASSSEEIGPGFGPDVVIGPNGFPYVSFGTSDEARLAVCLNAECTTATIRDLETTLGFVTETALSIGGDGLPIVGYHADQEEEFRVARCQDATCATAIVENAHPGGGENPPNAGFHPSAATGPDGGVWFSYQVDAGTSNAIFLVRCFLTGCGTPLLLDSISSQGGAVVGPHSSIAIDPSGLPLVLFRDSAEGLEAARCKDTDCTTFSTVVLGPAGAVPSVTLGVDGLPFVSYANPMSSELEVAHCSNWHCVPWFRAR